MAGAEGAAVPCAVQLGLTVLHTALYAALFLFAYLQLWLLLYYRQRRLSYHTLFSLPLPALGSPQDHALLFPPPQFSSPAALRPPPPSSSLCIWGAGTCPAPTWHVPLCSPELFRGVGRG